jgi:FMN-dependent NADH-azoreductase
MDVWHDSLPDFAGALLDAKYTRIKGLAFTDAQRDHFAVAERIAVRFALADRVVISTPMWNFGIPYKLKQWFDVIIQPGLTFRFDPSQGYLPLLKDRPTLVILASGSDYTTGMNRGRTDMATPYLREALRFIGVKDVRFVPIGPTTGPLEPIRMARESAHRRLSEMATRF